MRKSRWFYYSSFAFGLVVCTIFLSIRGLAQQTQAGGETPAAAAAERIRLFDSHITVNADGSMRVRETIEVQATGAQIRHGIYRDFPTRYKDRLGNDYSVRFEIVSVERNGRPEPYHVSKLSNGVRAYFGDANRLLPPGTYTYAFAYETDRQLGFFPGHDELYWNVTGNGWGFPIDLATAIVVLPQAVKESIQQVDAYTGYQGEKGKAFSSERDKDGNPTFRAEHLLANQGLTIVVTWPKGLIAAPAAGRKVRDWIADNKAASAGLIGLAAILFYYIVVWSLLGRDPRRGTIVPLYEPPDNMSPAAIRYLKRMGFDAKVFSSAIVDMAVKGYLRIGRELSSNLSDKYCLTRREAFAQAKDKLSADEKAVVQELFESYNYNNVWLEQLNYKLLQWAKKAMVSVLKAAIDEAYFTANTIYLLPGIVLAVAALTALFVLSLGEKNPDASSMSAFLGGWTAVVCLLITFCFEQWKALGGKEVGVLGLFALVFLASEILLIAVFRIEIGLLRCLAIVALIVSNIPFYYLLKAPTQAGRKLLDRVDGFKMFLEAVEGPRVATLLPVKKTPELFERFFPYALALGVEHAWMQQFAGVLAQAGTTPGGERGYKPSWYSGGSFAASSFAASLSSAVLTSSWAPGSSSGSDGGGSSGGGGGGGGGGGW